MLKLIQIIILFFKSIFLGLFGIGKYVFNREVNRRYIGKL